MAEVIVQECPVYDLEVVTAKLDAGLALLGGWKRFVHPGQKVLLKVNLIGPKTSGSAAVTHSEFVRALVRILKREGCEVWIGDSSGGAIAGMAPTKRAFEVSGLQKVAALEGAILKNFDREGAVEVTPPGKKNRLYLARPLFEADLVINLPKLKTHSAGVYTGAVKNFFGCVPGLRKAAYHQAAPDPGDLGQVFSDIHRTVKAGLHIMDGVIAMDGSGPTAGRVYPAHKVLISTDPLALDTVAARMIGLTAEEIPTLRAAIADGLGVSDLNRIVLDGDYHTIPVLHGFKVPRARPSGGGSRFLIRLIDFFKTRPRIQTRICKNCNTCVDSCPVGAIDRDNKRIDDAKCIECLCCHELCMYKAVRLKHDHWLAGLLTGFKEE